MNIQPIQLFLPLKIYNGTPEGRHYKSTAVLPLEDSKRNVLNLQGLKKKIPAKIKPPLPLFEPDYYVYTDGACSKNGSKHAIAGIGIYFGKDDPRNVSKRVVGKQTNNTAELTAIIETYPFIETDVLANKKIGIITDSAYAMKCVDSFGKRCSKNGYTSSYGSGGDIPNKELVKTVYELYKDHKNIQFIHCMAHTNNTDIHSIGNAGADTLAKQALSMMPPTQPYKLMGWGI
jgi:ribonuclease HI